MFIPFWSLNTSAYFLINTNQMIFIERMILYNLFYIFIDYRSIPNLHYFIIDSFLIIYLWPI